MEMPLDLDLSSLSTISRIVTCTIEGIVEQEDVALLLQAPAAPVGSTEGEIQKVREKHHSVARLVASGMTNTLAASISGYTVPYLTILLNAPAMQELVAYYRAQHSGGAEVIAARLRDAGMTAVEKLVEGMEADELDAQALLGLAKLGLDRSGHGPTSKVHQVTEHHLLDHAELQRLNRAARKESEADIIDLRALPAPGSDDESASSS